MTAVRFTALLITLTLALTACSKSDSQPTTSGTDQSQYDLIDHATQIKVKLNGHLFTIDTFIDAWYEIQVCSGLGTLPGPYIEVVDDDTNLRADGVFWTTDRVIQIKAGAVYYPELLEHEMLHFLLPPGTHHNSVLFAQCTPNVENID